MQALESENLQLKETVGWLHCTYTWELTGYTVPSRMYSPFFNVNGFEFCLDLNSAQPDDDSKNFTGLYLHMTKGWKARVKYEFQIINANDSNIYKSYSCECTYEKIWGYGTGRMLTSEAMKTYLKDGKVTVRAKVSVKLPDNLASAQILV